MVNDARDRAAERWLTDRHAPTWYLGDATRCEWDAAYAAVDASLTTPTEIKRSTNGD